MKKQIDEICRMLRDYARTGSSDIKLQDNLLIIMDRVSESDYKHNSYHYINYFIQSLRRELRSPEVIQRDSDTT